MRTRHLARISAFAGKDFHRQDVLLHRERARRVQIERLRPSSIDAAHVPAGYFIEAAINHYTMTAHKDARLYAAARKLADWWCNNLGAAPKKEWFDGHQEMEQSLVRFGRFVNQVEGSHRGDRYISLAKFLLDCRSGGTEYDQSHLPVQQQYEAVGHLQQESSAATTAVDAA